MKLIIKENCENYLHWDRHANIIIIPHCWYDEGLLTSAWLTATFLHTLVIIIFSILMASVFHLLFADTTGLGAKTVFNNRTSGIEMVRTRRQRGV